MNIKYLFARFLKATIKGTASTMPNGVFALEATQYLVSIGKLTSRKHSKLGPGFIFVYSAAEIHPSAVISHLLSNVILPASTEVHQFLSCVVSVEFASAKEGA